MFVVALAAIFAVPKGIELTNRLLEDYVIPRLALKRASAGEVKLYPIACDMALTKEEMEELQNNGGLHIMQQGAQRHHCIADVGKANVCDHCQRLQA